MKKNRLKRLILSANSLVAVSLLGFALPGCGKSNSNSTASSSPASPSSAQQGVAQADPSSLNGLSPQQLLQTKYDRAELDCNASLTVTTTTTTTDNNGVEGSTSSSPQTGSGSASLDLLHDYPNAKALSFKLVAGNVAYDVQVSVSKIAITPELWLSIGNDSYDLIQTPVLSISYIGQQEKPVNVGGMIENGGFGPSGDLLYENIAPADSVSSTDKVTAGGGSEEDITFQGVNCFFKTQLKPQYQDEWQKLN